MWSLGLRLAPPCTAVLLVATACGSPADEAAERQASALRSAVAGRDGDAACAALSARTASELEESSGKPCPEAILEEELPTEGQVTRVRVFGTMAEVEYDAETVFLSHYAEGWRVSAAGCTPTPSGIYDCAVTGG